MLFRSFIKDIEKSPILPNPPDDVTQLVNLYNSEFLRILDLHAPLIIRHVTVRPAAPWYSQEIKYEK